MADETNPFAKYAAAPQVDDNPFAKYASASPIGAPDPGDAASAFPKLGGSPAPAIDFTNPIEDVRKTIGSLPVDKQEGALKDWARTFVENERKDGGVSQTVSDAVRNVARGTPVGSWLDEANAATSAGLHNLTGGAVGAPYDETVAYQRATDDAIDKSSTKLGTLPLIGDVTAAGVQKVVGGVASAAATPVAQVMRGAGMLPQIVNNGVTGLGLGSLYGAGEGETTKERAVNAGKGAAIGTTLGAVAPVVARGVGNAVGYVGDLVRGVPNAVRGYSKPAVDRVSRAVRDDELPQTYARHRAELGPEGMIADMGDNLGSQASAIAMTPGRGMRTVREGLNDRHEGAAGRIRADVDANLGPAANIPETVAATEAYYRQQAAPFRQAFETSPVPFTHALEANLQHVVERHPNILRDAMGLAADARFAGLRTAPPNFFARQQPDGTWIIDRVPSATEWDFIKRSFDNMAQSASASRTDRTLYGNAARRIRDAVDEAISPGNPADSPWARARALEGENFRINDAVEAGAGAFKKGLTPDQMAAEMHGVGQPARGGMTPPELAGYRLGAREDVRNIMGNASTQWGENAATAARSKLGSDHAQEKLGHIVGPQAADDLIARLEAETTFAKTRQHVTQNSLTALRREAQQEFPNAAGPDRASNLGNKSLYGHIVEGTYRIANALLGGALNERRARIAVDAAEMLVAQGARRDDIARALIQYAQGNALSQARRDLITRLARTIMVGPRQQEIDAATAHRP
jgi:hypothetical protein